MNIFDVYKRIQCLLHQCQAIVYMQASCFTAHSHSSGRKMEKHNASTKHFITVLK